jgi:hypothetical protein
MFAISGCSSLECNAGLPGELTSCTAAAPVLRAAPQQPCRGVLTHATSFPPPAPRAGPTSRLVSGVPGFAMPTAAVEGRVAAPCPERCQRQPLCVMGVSFATAVAQYLLMSVVDARRHPLVRCCMVAVAAITVPTLRLALLCHLLSRAALLCIPVYLTLQALLPADVPGLQAELQQDAVEERVVARLEVSRLQLRLICSQYMCQSDLQHRVKTPRHISSLLQEYEVF